jgi:lycopene beta-cyclase
MRTISDILILGGGCAGLSLALRLAELDGPCPTTTVLESRGHYEADRTWCFWENEAARLKHVVSHRWNSVAVSAESREVKLDCAESPYAMIPAQRFYEHATRQVIRHPEMEIAMNAQVTSEPHKDAGLWHVTTTRGVFSGKCLIDTRPPREAHPGDAILWQSFSGYEVECDEPRFDPSTARLMDFIESKSGGVCFVYLLPFSPQRALIEVTVFGPDPLGPGVLKEELECCVSQATLGVRHHVIRSEHGVIPMGSHPARDMNDPTHVVVGVASGGARPATGFAFQRIQRWAEECAWQLADGEPPLGHAADPPLLRFMDRLFLRVIKRHPDTAPDLFLRLFELKHPAPLLRFLGDCGSVADCLRMICALPAGLFLGELSRSLFLPGIEKVKSQG